MKERTYDVDLNIVVAETFAFCRRQDVPTHWSKNRNERYPVHLMMVLYVLFCMMDKSYRRFEKIIKSAPPRSLAEKAMPSFSTLWTAWRRIPPRYLRRLVQQSGRGGRDRVGALDPTHFEISRPSISYCKRVQRNLMRDPNRKCTLVTGTRSLRILDATMSKDHHRNGLDDVPKLMNKWVRGKTVAADTEFDAEDRFHQLVLAAGGKGVAPLRHKGIPVWRTNGSRRKQLRRQWPGRSYRRRVLTETANSMLKRGLGSTLRGRTVGQQARHFYAKCLTHNLLMRCQE
jgi:hypothetical protein